MEKRTTSDFIYGTRAVIEAIEAGKEIDKLLIQRDLQNDLTSELLQVCHSRKIPFQRVPVEKLNRVTRKNHQGTIAFISPVQFASLDNIISSAYEKAVDPFLLILDRVTDVRNFGAIARTAECAGVHGIIVPSRGSAQIGADAMKTSAGALNHISVVRSMNLKETIKELQQNGIKVVACTEKSDDNIYQTDLSGPIALVMGSEEEGISGEYLRLADAKAKLPMVGQIESLNVSVATGVFIYETIRQRAKG